MSNSKKHTRFKYKKQFLSEPIGNAERERIEDLLAKLIAQAYAEENPEFFQSVNSNDIEDKESHYDGVKAK